MAAGGFLNVARFLANASGTGDFVVSSAITGFQTPASAGAVNATVYSYRAESTDLTEWEIGEGAYTTGTTTLARTTVHASSNAGAKVNFTAAPQVALVELAGDLYVRGSSAATDSFAGVVELATEAEMETATDTGRVPSVSVVQHHPGVCKGWAYVDTDGVLLAGHNLTSAKNSTGNYTVTIGTDMSTAFYATVVGSNSNGIFAVASGILAGSFTVETRNLSNTNTDGRFSVAIFGAQ